MFYDCFSDHQWPAEEWIPVLVTETRLVSLLQVLALQGDTPARANLFFQVGWHLRAPNASTWLKDTIGHEWLLQFLNEEADGMLRWLSASSAASPGPEREKAILHGPPFRSDRFKACLKASGAFRDAVAGGSWREMAEKISIAAAEGFGDLKGLFPS